MQTWHIWHLCGLPESTPESFS